MSAPIEQFGFPGTEEELEPLPIEEEEEKPKREMPKPDELRILLLSYWTEAETARKSGTEPRDDEWEANLDSFWSRYDVSKKAEWQSRNKLPETANFVERFSATMRQALVRSREWFTTTDPLDPGGQIAKMAQKLIKIGLERCGKGTHGHPVGFPFVFGSAIKAGALTNLAAAVTWNKEDGHLAIDPIDAREVYLDATGRNLYRIRRYEVDRHELEELADKKDSAGKPLYDKEAIGLVQSGVDEERKNDREKMSGHSESKELSPRVPVTLKEFLCTILDRDGREIAKNQLIVMANDKEIIRGPEPNPFWHGQDWIVSAPVIHIPFSVYGMSYVERFRALADSFVEFTNLLHDAVFTGSMNAFTLRLGALQNPKQAAEGVYPNVTFVVADDWPAGMPVLESVNLGGLGPDSFRFWQALKQELREASAQSDLGVGQAAPQGDTTATQIQASESNSAALTESIATDIEQQFLDVILNLSWFTLLQNMDPQKDPGLALELGPEMSDMLVTRRQEFRERRFHFRSHGISSTLELARFLRSLIGLLNVLGGNELLAQEFAKKHSLSKLISQILLGFNIDPERLEKSAEELAVPPPPPPGGPGAGGGAGGGGLADQTPAQDVQPGETT